MPPETLLFNGIDGSTGDYLTPPLTIQEVSKLAQGEQIDAGHLAELRNRHWRDTEPSFAPIADVDPKDLATSGWGVVFVHDADPAIREVLKELIEHRKSQAAGKQAHYFKEYSGPDGYRYSLKPDGAREYESKAQFLARHGAAAGDLVRSDQGRSPRARASRASTSAQSDRQAVRLWREKGASAKRGT